MDMVRPSATAVASSQRWMVRLASHRDLITTPCDLISKGKGKNEMGLDL